ncbi:MAG: DNA-formamidopyrimidine glycosylase [Hyphomicrobium sp.]|nr:MAG: DNA-formamidopyrimidine glycosylase [Hyphomicrobium sp.]
MPELPEVETVCRGLAPSMVGRRITFLEARRPDLRFPLPDKFSERVAGHDIRTLTRRAKYLILGLSSGDDVVMHLGMTGRFTVVRNGHTDAIGDYVYETGGDPKHDHVVLHLDDGTCVVYNDPRRFGFMMMMAGADRERHALFKNLGVEPLGNAWTADHLASKARGKKVNLKAFLMDQRVVAGLGNIYVSEALHRAGLSPNRRASTLSDKHGAATERGHRLVPAVREVLERAILAGGSTLRDYRHADGTSGAFQDAFAVYDRAGEPCVRPGCRGIVRRVVHGARATYFCGVCQR